MTQREKLLALLEEFGVTPSTGAELFGESTRPDEAADVVLIANHGGVEGYQEFYAYFSFDEAGAFESVTVAE
jgi:hypothetical protein